MASREGDLLAKVLLVAIFAGVGLFCLAAATVLAAAAYRNGVYDDGRFVEARVLTVVHGKPREAQVEYVVDGERYRRWVSCDTSCPKVAELYRVEYSAKDPGRVVRDRTGPPPRIAVAGLVATAVAIPTFALLLRRQIRTTLARIHSTRPGAGRPAAQRPPRRTDLVRFRNGAGLIAVASGMGGAVTIGTRGAAVPGIALLGLCAIFVVGFFWLAYRVGGAPRE
ncbi:hypothetical protein [Rhizomonospora bruguierae]|uniref:hypothetical protein n=1 Tax=Rhizomonospora bruguierae TaxID=1581705 RepID=UPI001BCEB173|nr:hypothetical protein [Micromonospora sp. NBRC 107566]